MTKRACVQERGGSGMNKIWDEWSETLSWGNKQNAHLGKKITCFQPPILAEVKS